MTPAASPSPASGARDAGGADDDARDVDALFDQIVNSLIKVPLP